MRRGTIAMYFDNFGNLRPLKELVRHFRNNVTIEYNRTSYQTYNQELLWTDVLAVSMNGRCARLIKPNKMLQNLSIYRTLFP